MKYFKNHGQVCLQMLNPNVQIHKPKGQMPVNRCSITTLASLIANKLNCIFTKCSQISPKFLFLSPKSLNQVCDTAKFSILLNLTSDPLIRWLPRPLQSEFGVLENGNIKHYRTKPSRKGSELDIPFLDNLLSLGKVKTVCVLCCLQPVNNEDVYGDAFLPGTMVVHAAYTVSTAAAVVWPLWPHKVAFIAQLPLFTF